jgi:hypothetical protein
MLCLYELQKSNRLTQKITEKLGIYPFNPRQNPNQLCSSYTSQQLQNMYYNNRITAVRAYLPDDRMEPLVARVGVVCLKQK